MNRCVECKEKVLIPASRELGSALRVWSSYAELAELANSGCDLCALFRQYLSTYISEKALREIEGEVKLYGGGKDLSLECAAFRGSLNIFPTDASENLRSAPPRQGCDIFGQAEIWLSRCLSYHNSCREQSVAEIDPVSQLPNRLLDLSHGTSVLVVNVIEWISSGLATISEFSEYCTLSYRWGTTSHDCVLTAPFETLLELPLSSMPQTFKDGITATRNLGIRFLWIDALCIVQPAASGDDSDWHTEGSRMGIIYQNALLNVSATCADKAEEGFLAKVGASEQSAVPCTVILQRKVTPTSESSDRPLPGTAQMVEEEVTLPVCKPSFFEAVSSSILNSRGWVMQERALSKRLLHFTEHGMFWECCEAKAHDQFGDFDLDRHNGPCRTKETLLSIARARRTRHLCPVEWFHFIRRYSFAGFTDTRDRLVALSSVARATQPILGGHKYFAGLWRNDLVRGLMWHAHKPSMRLANEHGAVTPSWSWASVAGSIDFAALGLDTFGCELVDVVDVQTKPALATNPFGNLREGKLRLLGRLDTMVLPMTNSFEWSPRQIVHWDEAQDTLEERRPFTILPLGGCVQSFMSCTLFGALILNPETPASGAHDGTESGRVYRRIGWVQYMHSRSGYSRYSRMKQDWISNMGEEIIII